jgi:hypothetical protein
MELVNQPSLSSCLVPNPPVQYPAYPAARAHAELVWQWAQVLEDLQKAAVRQVTELVAVMMMMPHAACW